MPRLAGRSSVQGGVYRDATNASGLNVTNVEARDAVDGATIHGSDIAVAGLNSHNNRHSGFFVQGLPELPAPHNTAHNITLQGSRFAVDAMDNRPGKTWDEIDVSDDTANVTIGGLQAGQGNTITDGDVLIGCPPWYSKCARTPTGPFLVQGNIVTVIGQVQGIGIRAFGNVTGAVFDHNTVNTDGIGIGMFGGVINSRMTNNVVSGEFAYGVLLQPISSYRGAGHSILVESNSVKMGDQNKPAFSVQQATNATLSNNNGNGAPYDTSEAGAGLVMTRNH